MGATMRRRMSLVDAYIQGGATDRQMRARCMCRMEQASRLGDNLKAGLQIECVFG